MAGSKTGVPSIYRLARKICRLVGTYGAGDMISRTSVEFNDAILALVVACQALELLDDQFMQIDATAPIRPGEDVEPS